MLRVTTAHFKVKAGQEGDEASGLCGREGRGVEGKVWEGGRLCCGREIKKERKKERKKIIEISDVKRRNNIRI